MFLRCVMYGIPAEVLKVWRGISDANWQGHLPCLTIVGDARGFFNFLWNPQNKQIIGLIGFGKFLCVDE